MKIQKAVLTETKHIAIGVLIGDADEGVDQANRTSYGLAGAIFTASKEKGMELAARIEEEYLPDLDRVLDAVDRTFGW